MFQRIELVIEYWRTTLSDTFPFREIKKLNQLHLIHPATFGTYKHRSRLRGLFGPKARQVRRLGNLHCFHLAAAAFWAISLRSFAVSFWARAFAPACPLLVRPDFLLSSISPVAIRPTMIAAPMTSAGRFSPLGPFGIRSFPPFHRTAPAPWDR